MLYLLAQITHAERLSEVRQRTFRAFGTTPLSSQAVEATPMAVAHDRNELFVPFQPDRLDKCDRPAAWFASDIFTSVLPRVIEDIASGTNCLENDCRLVVVAGPNQCFNEVSRSHCIYDPVMKERLIALQHIFLGGMIHLDGVLPTPGKVYILEMIDR